MKQESRQELLERIDRLIKRNARQAAAMEILQAENNTLRELIGLEIQQHRPKGNIVPFTMK